MARIARRWTFLVPCALGALLTTSTAAANVWNEVGDAGDLLATAQQTLGLGALTEINGTIDTSQDKDMYEIEISGPAVFSATVIAGGSLTDTQLFLFDAAGQGVYGNDDDVGPLSKLPAGDASGPSVAGIYYLAISGPDNDPTAGALEVFTDNVLGVQTPVVAAPVDGWTNTFSVFGGTYTIELTGAKFSNATGVPALGTWGQALLAAGLGTAALLLLLRRRRARALT
jgi:hypothetical protein